MRHAREDYNRIQDPAFKIGPDEPVFLLRAQDKSAPATLRFWAEENRRNGGDPALTELAQGHADAMVVWQHTHDSKPADLEVPAADQRLARIATLERELADLRRQDNEARKIDHDALLAECRELKRAGRPIEAVKHYRAKVGSGLREAHDVVSAL